MADPEARVVITAKDTTAAAFTSAERGIKTFARSLREVRQIAAGFGLVFTGRMFANWIKDAIEVEKLTVDQAAAIGNASKAFGSLNTELQDIARTIAAELSPSLETAAKFWREFFFPSGSQFGAASDRIREQVDAQITEVERLETLLNSQTGFDANANWFQKFVFGDHSANITETTNQLAAARSELERLRKSWLGAQGPSGSQFITQEEWIQLESFLYDMNKGLADVSKGQSMSQEMTAYVDLLQDGAKLTADMRTDVEKQVDEWHRVQDLLANGAIDQKTADRFRDSLLEPVEVTAKRIKKLKPEAEQWALSLGKGMESAFAGWLSGSETNFRDFLKRMAAEFAASQIFSALATGLSGSTGGIAGFFSSVFGGARANGGPVSGGKAYLVGERGPELFVPGASGSIAANTGTTVNVVNNVDARGASDDLIKALPGILAANRAQTQSDLLKILNRPSMA